MHFLNKLLLLTFLSCLSISAWAVPADWSGSLAFDTNIIKDFRRTGGSCDATKNGECILADENNARFQSMTLKLNPTIIVNDGVTLKGELSTGSNRTVNLGQSTQANPDASSAANTEGGSYFAQTTSSTMNVNQIYAELFADTALYRIGRFSKHYGLGAVINNGEKSTDRFFSGYEGIEAGLKLGNFRLTPMWAKLHTNAKKPNGKYDAYETSVEAMYDNPNRNMKFGVYYGIREIETNNELYGVSSGSQKVTIIDVFFAKEWEKLGFQLEIPMLSGEVKNTYGTGDADIDTNAYILETTYKLNNKWNVGINAGMVKGDDGETNSFEGMYLHPNYQIAEIMYRYNYHGFNDNSKDVYNSSIVNSTYTQLFFHYAKGVWRWKLSALMAKANQVAESGKSFYNHAKKTKVLATQDQKDDLGYEFDISFEYQWNPSVEFSGYLGYHVVGDYYKFSNDTEEIDTANVMASGMRLSVNF